MRAPEPDVSVHVGRIENSIEVEVKLVGASPISTVEMAAGNDQ
jgi:hypothetical protein